MKRSQSSVSISGPKFQPTLFTAALMAACFSVAGVSAATVTYTLDLSVDNMWELRASASLGDNGGITRYEIPLIGTVTSLDHRSPNVFKFGPGNWGFSNVRTADAPAGEVNPTVRAAQDLATPLLIYGFGQTPGMFTGTYVPNDPTSDTSWFANLVIARGAYIRAAGTLGFNTGSPSFLGQVFESSSGNVRIPAQIQTQIIPFVVPEPSAVVLCGLALAGLMSGRHRRRRQPVRSSRGFGACG